MSTASDYDKETMGKGVSIIAAAVYTPQVTLLQERVTALEKIVEMLRLQIDIRQDQQAHIEIAEPPSTETVNAVAASLRRKGEAYPSDIADELGISLREVLAAIARAQNGRMLQDSATK